jgi:S1-C subfamily serine protease
MVKPLLLAFAMLCACTARAGLPEQIARIKPSIVAVGTYQKLRSPALQIRGSGFVIGDGQTVVTNLHVLSEQAASDERLVVVIPGSPLRLLDAEAQARDRDHDLALLRIGTALPALRLAAPEPVREGQEIFFTGFPIGAALGAVPVTHRGIIAAITPMALPAGNDRQINSAAIRQLRSGPLMAYQLDATAYPGNSGSALLDAESGDVLGIINMVFVKGAKESALSQPTGISFAIPVRYLIELLGRR